MSADCRSREYPLTDANTLLLEIAGVGVDPVRGGYTRLVYSSAETALRAWFTAQAEARRLSVETDGNGIMWGWWDLPGEPEAHSRRSGAIVTGSHLDSVPGGGNFDGPLGVVSALAAIDHLRARGITPVRPLAVVVFPEEEGSRFGVACLGSRLLTGAVAPEHVRSLRDESGASYAAVAEQAGANPALIGADPARLSSIAAFIELHVEQGRGLIDLGAPVAVAGAIIAHGRWHVRIEGRGDHAGATRMQDRQDPVVVAAEIIRALRTHTLTVPEARGTVGRVHVTPGGTNVIASAVDLWMDVRHRDDRAVRKIVAAVTAEAQVAATGEGCRVIVTEQSFSPTVTFASELRETLQRVLPDAPVLDTGAGHDAGVLAAMIPTGMLFVRNPSGASHTPAENATEEDVRAGVTALTDVLEHLLTHTPSLTDRKNTWISPPR